jgi:hypothetical protein
MPLPLLNQWQQPRSVAQYTARKTRRRDRRAVSFLRAQTIPTFCQSRNGTCSSSPSWSAIPVSPSSCSRSRRSLAAHHSWLRWRSPELPRDGSAGSLSSLLASSCSASIEEQSSPADCRHAFGIVCLEPPFCGFRVGECLDVIGIADVVSGVDVDPDGFHHISLFKVGPRNEGLSNSPRKAPDRCSRVSADQRSRHRSAQARIVCEIGCTLGQSRG